MRIVVTHYHPDVDAVTSVWLIKTFYPGWEEADIVFVPAGSTYKGKPSGSDPDILHVDTGLGKFDHHQTSKRICAARLVFEYLRDEHSSVFTKEVTKEEPYCHWNEEALDRLTRIVVDIDHFGHIHWQNPDADIYEFSFESILDGWKLLYRKGSHDREIVEWGMRSLDGIYQTFVNKVWAEQEIEEKAELFKINKGKVMSIETINDETLTIAQKQGCVLVVRKDPHKGYVRIKARPDSGLDLTLLYEALKKKDSDATWFLHMSKMMLLNGTTKNPNMKPTKLSLKEIVTVVKRVVGSK